MKFTYILRETIITMLGCTSIFYSSNALADAYYISPTGTATWGSACQTPVLGTAACKITDAELYAVAGDTVYFREGSYLLEFESAPTGHYWKAGFHPTHSGTATNPITFAAYEDEDVFLDNSLNSGQAESVATYSTSENDGTSYDYIIFDGLDLICVGSSGPYANDCVGAALKSTTGSVIRNADLEGIPNGLSISSPVRIEYAHNAKVYNNKIHGSLGTDNSCGILSYKSTGSEIYNNDVYNNTVGIYEKSWMFDTLIHNNFVYNNSVGIGVAGESGPPSSSGIMIYQNVVLDCVQGIRFFGGEDATDCDIYNNTIVQAPQGIAIVQNRDIGVWNNIITSNAVAAAYYAPASVDYVDYNQYTTGTIQWDTDGTSYDLAGWQSVSGLDINSITDNPNFINAGGTSAVDYKRSSYPADGRGGAFASIRGAYITGNEQIGASSTSTQPSPPSPPARLRIEP